MDLHPKKLTACILFALAEMKYGVQLRNRFRLWVSPDGSLQVVV